MTRSSKFCALILVFLLALVLPTVVFADQEDLAGQTGPKDKNATVEILTDEELAAQEELEEEESEIDEEENEDELTREEVLANKAAKDLLKAEKRELKLTVKGQEMKLDVPPVVKEGRVLIPLRALAAITGAEVTYVPREGENPGIVTFVMGEDTITITIGENQVKVNDEYMFTDAEAEIMNGRTIVPLRFIAETLEIKVNYDAESNTVDVDAGVETEDDEEVANNKNKDKVSAISDDDDGDDDEEEEEDDDDSDDDEEEEDDDEVEDDEE